MSLYDDSTQQDERQIIGYCGYDKSEIREGDDVVRYKGQMYHRENFIQMNLDGHGNIIDGTEEEE
jgi:hypothetical protein